MKSTITSKIWKVHKTQERLENHKNAGTISISIIPTELKIVINLFSKPDGNPMLKKKKEEERKEKTCRHTAVY